jgi:plastocyanin domain-containing protein
MRGSAVVLAALALVCGCSKDGSSGAASVSPWPLGSAAASARATEIPVVVDSDGFTPSSVDVTQGTATTLVFKRTTDQTCAKQVVFPDLKLTRDLPLNEPVPIAVPTTTRRTLTFQCGMGMYKSSVVVH